MSKGESPCRKLHLSNLAEIIEMVIHVLGDFSSHGQIFSISTWTIGTYS